VKFDRENPCASKQELFRDHAVTGTDVEHEIPAGDVSERDQPPCPTVVELVPSPPAGTPGHGAPSPSSCRQSRRDASGDALEMPDARGSRVDKRPPHESSPN
jgi:hypothetical protein